MKPSVLKKLQTRWKALSLFLAMAAFSSSSYASQAAQYPWASTLKQIMDSLSGPVAYALAGIMVVSTGFIMAFADLQGGAKKGVQVALGISIAFGATTILSSFFNFTGAVV